MTVKRPDTDHCVSCGSENLWSNFFDADDLGCNDDSQPGSRWATFCQDCGTEQP